VQVERKTEEQVPGRVGHRNCGRKGGKLGVQSKGKERGRRVIEKGLLINLVAKIDIKYHSGKHITESTS
jgi:hypothetical protein